MFHALEDARDYIERHEIAMVDLKFTDLWGRWHHVTLSPSRFNAALMERGVGFDGSSVGLRSVKSGDMVLIPDLATAAPDPFWNEPTLSFICSVFEADTRAPYPRDPRGIARRAEAFLKDTGIGDESRWGPEFEFYVFDDVSYENGAHRAGYRLDSSEAEWQSATAGHGHLNPRRGGYHAIPPRDQLFNLRSEMARAIEDMGVRIKYHHHEVGGPGQCEIETGMMGLLEAGDAAQTIKYVTKMTAFRHGKSVTYMPKPLHGEAGNGMHFHQQLLKEGKNLFYDADGYGRLSRLALHYIGGLLYHAPALLALTNPSTNSYRRLVPGFEAPVHAFFSVGNRSAAIRVPKYADGPASARCEFRSPDATSNVYLALAAQLMAGLDGIRNQIDPREHGFGPFDEDIAAWPEEQRARLKSLPGTLKEACDALEKDHAFLEAGNVFEQDLLEDWVRHKLDAEYYPIQTRPHPYEMALYYDV